MSAIRFDQYLSCLCLIVALGLLPVRSYVSIMAVPAESVKAHPAIQLTAAPIPVLKTSAGQPQGMADQLGAKAIYVMDVPSATVLLAKNPDIPYYPASTTKLMSALVALDTYQLDRVLVFTEQSMTDGTIMGLEVGEELTVQDLLQGLLITSGNDAAMLLANNHPGGYPGFIQAMNQKAAELDLSQTFFTNPSGLDDPVHQASARDLAILSYEIIKDPVLSQIVRTKTSMVTDVSLQFRHPLVNTNALLSLKPEVMGVKTGTTPLAGEVLITRYQDGTHDFLVVVMGSQDRYADTLQVYDWVLSNYIWMTPDSATLTGAK